MSENSRFQVCDFDIYKLDKDAIPDDDELMETADAIVDAIKSNGLVFLKNTGFNTDLVTKAWQYFKSFLELSPATRDNYREHAEPDCGVKVGCYSSGNDGGYPTLLKEETESLLFIPFQPNLAYPETELLGFTKDMFALFKEMSCLLRRVAECVSLGYQKDRYGFDYALEKLKRAETGNISGLRLNYYGPLMKTEENSSRVRFVQHYDVTILTLIMTDREGFQMRNKEGQWIDVPVIPDTCLVLAGKALPHICGQQFHALPHRVVARGSDERKTVAMFLHHDTDTLLQPAADAAEQRSLSMKEILPQYEL